MNFVLRALDGALAGASHREIAEALIGRARVRSDWNDPQSPARSYPPRRLTWPCAHERRISEFLL
ncbi:DUF2285 domain-containing protein [Mesorhizobium sp. M0910]|uniref:DNA -binding domain-containing protein n=1 Tax=Mesorhizobium sp. M0910 TaxID=2957025 RepID=UPI00333C5F70